jgi:hypothetical protein
MNQLQKVLDILLNVADQIEVGSATHGPVGTIMFLETGIRMRDWKHNMEYVSEVTGLTSSEIATLEDMFWCANDMVVTIPVEEEFEF